MKPCLSRQWDSITIDVFRTLQSIFIAIASMNISKENLNRSFLHALIAGILLSPVSFMLDVLMHSELLIEMRGLLRSPVSGLAFVLMAWLLAGGVAFGINRMPFKLSKWQKDGVIIVSLLPLLLLMLALRG
jgi:hypothetical protein